MLNRRNNHAMTAYDPFREMDNFERHFFEDPFGVFFSNDSQSAFKTDITPTMRRKTKKASTFALSVPMVLTAAASM